MKIRFFIILFLIITFFSCGDEKGKDFPPTPQDPKDSSINTQGKIENNFSSLLKGINISNINQYIHPEKGLWIINSSGAMPNMTNTTQVDKNFPLDFNSVKDGELPKVNCDSKSLWTKEGCFVNEENTLPDGKVWTYCGFSKEDETNIEETVKMISWTVINTSLYAKYYFSHIGGEWYLAFVDLRKPCEA